MPESRFFCPFCGNRLTIAAANAEEYEVWCLIETCEGGANSNLTGHDLTIMLDIWGASEDVGIELCEEWAEARPELKVRFP